MILVCHTAFGNCVPGDEVEVPDGHSYDHGYFAAKVVPPAPSKQKNPPAPAGEEK